MKYTISTAFIVSKDIQSGVDYYNSKRPKQGANFKKTVFSHLKSLSKNPFYQVRYDNVRCLPIKKYPYMLHFTVNEEKNIVYVEALLHTAKDNRSLK